MVNTQMETMETWDKGHGQKYHRSTANFSQCLQVIITIIQLIRSSTFLACAISLQKWLRDKEIEQGYTVQDQECVPIASSFAKRRSLGLGCCCEGFSDFSQILG